MWQVGWTDAFGAPLFFVQRGSDPPMCGDAASVWPVGSERKDYVDEGTAQTMCDLFNARDYPEEFHTQEKAG
jgi:hypothetical protein